VPEARIQPAACPDERSIPQLAAGRVPVGGRRIRGPWPPGRASAATARRQPAALAVLACLDQRPVYPYEVARSLLQGIAAQGLRVSHGSLYTSIGILARQGLIAAQDVRSGGRQAPCPPRRQSLSKIS
jgi:hypothetical protein